MRDKSNQLLVVNTGRREPGSNTDNQTTRKTGGSGGGVVGGSQYLLKSIWDKCWEIRTTDKGEEYIFGKLPVAVQFGLTSYVDGGYLDLPSIYDGLVIDNQTIYWEEIKEEAGTDEEGNPIYKTTKILKSKGGGSGGGEGTVSGDYLPLTGGTLTGDLTIKNASFAVWNDEVELYKSKIRMTSAHGGSDRLNISYDESGKKLCIQSGSYDGVTKRGFMSISGIDEEDLQRLYINAVETKFSGNILLQKDSEKIGGSIKFGDGYTYIKEQSDDHLLVYSKDWITLKLDASDSYVKVESALGLGINGGLINYNSDLNAFILDGNLLVKGGITSFASDGKATPFLLDVTEFDEITSNSTTQVYTANTVSLLKKQLDTVDTKADASETRISNLKTALEGLSATSVAGLVRALQNLVF